MVGKRVGDIRLPLKLVAEIIMWMHPQSTFLIQRQSCHLNKTMHFLELFVLKKPVGSLFTLPLWDKEARFIRCRCFQQERGIFQQTGVSLCEVLPLKMEKVILGL